MIKISKADLENNHCNAQHLYQADVHDQVTSLRP